MQALVGLASRVSISPYIVPSAVSTGCTMIFNFLVMTHFVFAKEAFAVTVDSNSVCAPFADLRPSADQGVAVTADLPCEVVDVMRQRGVTGGPVLLLTGCAPDAGLHAAAPQFQLTCGSINEAPALASRHDFAAVVLILDGSRAGEFESTLGAIAPQLAPGTLLVARTLRARRSRDALATASRDSEHLSLLRSGYERVWMHSGRKRLCISAQRGCAASAVRDPRLDPGAGGSTKSDTFPELMRTLLANRLDHLGLEREIILIESNSSDGTRELVAGFAATPGVRIIYQDRPRGKGHAVACWPGSRCQRRHRADSGCRPRVRPE